MLVLTRKSQEAVVVRGPEGREPMLTVTVLEISGGKVRLGFQAGPAVLIHRWEVWQEIHVQGAPVGPAGGRGPPAAG